jgi:uncharacterized membrane protein
MLRFFFKYPADVFHRGRITLLGPLPTWMLWVAIAIAVAALGFMLRSQLSSSSGAPLVRRGRAGIIWLLQSALAAVLLILLWQPVILITQLKPQQDIVAVLVDDSRSMTIAERGATRIDRVSQALGAGPLAALQKKFQTRLYRVDAGLTRISDLKELKPGAPATHIADSLRQLVDETSDLPLGAIVLVSDGSDNTGGIDLDTIAALRSRRIPVHTVGIGDEHPAHDVELDDAVLTPRALATSRVSATVSFHQFGYAGKKALLSIRDGAKVLAGQTLTLRSDGETQSETLLFGAGDAGAKALQFSLDVQPGEENASNNAVIRLLNVESDRRRVLYVEGEPRWEYKFIRRAEDDDPMVQVVSMLRTTENKIYRQGISSGTELAEGFPAKPENLFGYQAIIVGAVEANYFTSAQQQLIRDFVDRRGGGLLMLGGRTTLADGGWAASSLADMLPVVLPNARPTYHVDPATVALAPAGIDSPITRLDDNPKTNAERWQKLPFLMDYQDPGTPKPGAAVLAEMVGGGRKMPLLVTQNYGHGRVAVLASGGTWRWQMNTAVGDTAHDLFWQQLVRWLIVDAAGPVVASVPKPVIFDDSRVMLSADVRGKDYQPVPDARVEAHVIGPGGVTANLEMTPVTDAPGSFQAEWTAAQPGSYLTEVTATRGGESLGRDVLTFQRIDGVAENFHTGQNRELLQRLSSQTGGRYWKPEELSTLADSVSYSEAGVTTRETLDLWNMPAVFLLILLLRATEWLLRRKWGVV